MDRTYVILKPDCIERGLIGEVIKRIEQKGLKITHMRLCKLPKWYVEEHYAEHKGRPYYESLVDGMALKNIVEIVVDGPHAVVWMRNMAGETFGAKPGTIRGDLAVNEPIAANIIHTSADADAAKAELARAVKLR